MPARSNPVLTWRCAALALSALALLALPRAANAQNGPPGTYDANAEVNLLTPDLAAPDQSEDTPGLSLLRQVLHRQTLRLPGSDLVVEIDGSVKVTPVYGVFALRFGTVDPYRLEVRRALESTFNQRLEMAERFREAAIEFSLGDLPRYLGGVWKTDGWPVELRKRILFALWDECAEQGNRTVVDGGTKARVIIEAFVRWQLPERSRNAFTRSELARLNDGRTSKERFDPYGKSFEIPGETVALALTF